MGLAGGIPERRVRPIWDAVDSRQYKNALKLCAALLPKFPNSPYALALKALVLERMGKPDEALSVCLNAREQLFVGDIIHMDDLTLSTLQMVFQRLNRLDLATSCYEHACGKHPNNLEHMMGLFNCYVREYSYVKQQQMAIKMYKIGGEERFLLWAICSIQLQVSCGNAGDKLLSLAEALLKKHVAAHSLHEPESILVYISILEQQAKYGAALEIISGSLGSLLPMEVDRYRIQGRLLVRIGDYAAAVDIFCKALDLCPDDWESFLLYLACLLEDQDMIWREETTPSAATFKCKNCNLSENLFEERVESALSFVKKLLVMANGDFLRCPYLAVIEIERRRRLYKKTDDRRIVDALMEYFKRFSHWPCFTSDIEMFADVLSQEDKEFLLDIFVESSKSSSLSPSQALGQTVTLFQVKEFLRSTLPRSVDDIKDVSFYLVDTFCKNLYLSRDLDPQENIHGEQLLTMAANALVQVFWRTRDASHLLEAIMVLEFGITVGRHAWQHKLLLVHLYSHMGALPLAYKRYRFLDIKNILLESMSHHILGPMQKSPFWGELLSYMSEYLKFMDDYLREAADHTFVAYRHRNYSKAVEFVLFKEKLQNSAQYLMAKVESSILELKQKADSLEQIESVLENIEFGVDLPLLASEEKLMSLTFNEDLQSRPWWSPLPEVNVLLEPYCETYDPRRKTGKDRAELTKRVIKRRSLIPRLLFLSIRVAGSPVKEKVIANGMPVNEDDVSRNSAELESLLEKYSATFGLSLVEAREMVVAVSEKCRPLEDMATDLPCWMILAAFLDAFYLRRPQEEKPDSSVLTWTTTHRLFCRCVEERLSLAGSAADFPLFVQLVTEAFSFYGLILQARFRSTPQPSSGKRKKKIGGPPDHPGPIAALCHVTQTAAEALRAAIQQVERWVDVQLGSATSDSAADATLTTIENGKIFGRLEETARSGTHDAGDRITRSLQSWDAAGVARNLVLGQRRALTEFQGISQLRLKRLNSLRSAAS